jgi:phosphatidylserine decarboxylase
MLTITLILALLVPVISFVASLISVSVFVVSWFPFALWCAFAVFVLYFFRDPTPRVPSERSLVVSPAHGKIDVIDTLNEPQFMGGQCQRISMFLSVLDVHVQNAPVSGRVAYFKYTEGQFKSAIKTESAAFNENVLIGFEASEPLGIRIGLRLIAGVLARRIVPWVEAGDEVARGDRISLIQFGSRCDLYLPPSAQIKIKLGDKVVGGETVLAVFD